MTTFLVLSVWQQCTATARVHLVHVASAAQMLDVTKIWTRPKLVAIALHSPSPFITSQPKR